MKKLKKRTYLIIIIIAVLAIISAWYFWPEPSIDDSDLKATWIGVPGNDNGFLDVNFTIDDIYYPPDPKRFEIYREIEDGKKWDESVAREMVENNMVLFETISKALDRKGFQMPMCQNMWTHLPYVSPWREIARIGKIRAKLLIDEGKKAEALKVSAMMIDFGYKIMNSANCYLTFLVGRAVFIISWQSFHELMKNETLTSSDLKPFIDRFSDLEISSATAIEILKREYTLHANTLDGYSSGKYKIEELFGGTLPNISHPEAMLFFNAKKTKALLAQGYRATIQNMSKEYSKRENLEPLFEECHKAVRLSANYLGKRFAADAISWLPSSESNLYMSRILCRAMPVMVALKCYELDHGTLPDTLNQLVPDYLKAVPLDPFDNKPLRYSKEKKMLYSIGQDLVDSGGIQEEELNEYRKKTGLLDAKDPTIIIDF